MTPQDVEKQREVITAWALLGKTPIQTENPQGHKNKIIRFFIYQKKIYKKKNNLGLGHVTSVINEYLLIILR